LLIRSAFLFFGKGEEKGKKRFLNKPLLKKEDLGLREKKKLFCLFLGKRKNGFFAIFEAFSFRKRRSLL